MILLNVRAAQWQETRDSVMQQLQWDKVLFSRKIQEEEEMQNKHRPVLRAEKSNGLVKRWLF